MIPSNRQRQIAQNIMLAKRMDIANIVFGPTQYGKSTFLNKIILHQENDRGIPQTGNGSGKSVTTESRLYLNTLIGPTVDVPGINDTGLLVDQERIEKQVSLLLTEQQEQYGIERVRFLLFDSLGDSSTQIRASLEQLEQAFGKHSKESIVVIASKLDRADEDELEDRLGAMENIMADCGIGSRLVQWKSKKCTQDEWAEQVKSLSDALQQTPPSHLNQLEDLNARIKARARKLCDKQKPKMRTAEIETTENYVTSHVEMEAYKKTVWKREKVADNGMLITRNRGAGIATYVLSLGIGAVIDNALNGDPVYETREKTVTKERPITVYDNKPRTVTKTIQVPHYLLGVESFLDQARIEILNETRRSLLPK